VPGTGFIGNGGERKKIGWNLTEKTTVCRTSGGEEGAMTRGTRPDMRGGRKEGGKTLVDEVAAKGEPELFGSGRGRPKWPQCRRGVILNIAFLPREKERKKERI